MCKRSTYVYRNAVGNRICSLFVPAMMTALACSVLCLPAHAAISQTERNALLDLYNNLNGTSWRTSTNWSGSTGSECTWYGVTCNSGETAVTGLDLSANLLAGTIQSSLGNLTSLQDLNLSGNQLTGSIPSSLGSLSNLSQVNLSGNDLSGPIPSFFSSRSTLQVLRLSGNQLGGSIPPLLGSLTKLQQLYLSANKLGGTIPPELGNLTNLQELILSSNQLGGGIPPELGNLTNLQVLNLSANQLAGSIPSSLGGLTKLQSLYLLTNKLSGSIPSELGNLANLQQLILSTNQLSGTIPASLGGLKNLLIMDLGSNQLSSSIPSSLGNLTTLLLLDLSFNRLSGAIPSSLGNLTKLVVLDMSSNALSGTVPLSLSHLASLGSIGIAYNALGAGDSTLRGFLDLLQPGWEETETVAPAYVDAAATSDRSVKVSWSPIAYTADSGRYEIWSSTTSGGPYALSGLTVNKSVSSLLVNGLTPGTYYFVVKATTDAGVHNRNSVSSDSSAEISIEVGPKIASKLSLGAGGAATTGTLGGSGATQAGYATVNVNSGAAPYGTAVFTYRQNGTTVSEAGVAASAPTTSAVIFIDYRTGATIPGSTGKVDVSTGFAAVNAGTGTAAVTAILRSLDGQVINSGTGSIAKGAHVAKYVNQLSDIFSGFSIPSSFPVSTRFGTLELTSNQPLSIVALRLTTNKRGDTLMTTTPIADRTAQITGTPVFIPHLVDGGGYTTTVILLNTSGSPETGTLDLYANDGSRLTVRQVNGPSASSFTYSIPPQGAYAFQTDASPAAFNAGWIKITPGGGTSTPVGGGIFQYSLSGVLVTESGIPAVTPTTHARVFVDTSDGHDTGLALGNPGNGSVNITLTAFALDGSTQAGTSQGPIALAGNGHIAAFVDEYIAGLPSDFRGVLDVSSDSPFVALTLRSLVNERGDFLLTTFPIADMTKAAPSPIIIPQFADGGGFTTEFILLSAGPSAVTTVSFFDDTGAPVALSLSR